MSIVIMLIIGAIAGWLAGQLVEGYGYGYGIVGNMVVGIVGAMLAGFILPSVGMTMGGGVFASIFQATIGAVILLFLIKLIKKA